MKRFKNILLVLHGNNKDEDAVKRAFALARTNRAKITIVDVMEELPHIIKNYLDIVSVKELEKIAIEERTSEIKVLIKPIEKMTRAKYRVKILVGKPYVEVVKEVLRNKIDLVMKTPEGKGGAREALFGHIDINIMRKCPCPVWMIKPTKHKKYLRILAAVDPVPDDEIRNNLNDNILELAISLSKIDHSDLHIIHAWSLYGEKALMGPRFRKTKQEMKKLLQTVQYTHQQLLDNLIHTFRISKIKHKLHLLKGDPADLIPSVARKEKIDLIVMGTVCRTGLPGFLIGNTAENILHKVNCSVLCIKPQGFISPIKL